jgi:hypothetical protein
MELDKSNNDMRLKTNCREYRKGERNLLPEMQPLDS